MDGKSPRQLYIEAIGKRREYIKNIGMEIYRDGYKKGDKRIFFSEIEGDTDEIFYKKLEGISNIVINNKPKKVRLKKYGNFEFKNERNDLDREGFNVGELYYDAKKIGHYIRVMFNDGSKGIGKYTVYLKSELIKSNNLEKGKILQEFEKEFFGKYSEINTIKDDIYQICNFDIRKRWNINK